MRATPRFSQRGHGGSRALVLTDTHLLKLNAAKQYALKSASHPVAVAAIAGVTLPAGPEPVVILHLRDGPDEVRPPAGGFICEAPPRGLARRH